MKNFEKLVELGKTDISKLATKVSKVMDCNFCPINEDCDNDINIVAQFTFEKCANHLQKWLESEAEE